MNPVYEKDLRSLLDTQIGLVVWHIAPRVSHTRPTDVLEDHRWKSRWNTQTRNCSLTACVFPSFSIEQFSLDCRIGIGFGFGFGFTTSFGWLVYLLWFWFYDSQVKTALL